MARLPRLSSLTFDKLGRDTQPLPEQLAPFPAPPKATPRRRFGRTPVTRRRGPSQANAGQSYLESRAAQDVDLPVAERIILKDLRRRGHSFDFHIPSDDPLVIGGYTVDFLILDVFPQVALDVFSSYEIELQKRHPLKPAVLDSLGYRYEVVTREDIEDALGLERTLDLILGRQVGGSLP